MGKDTKIQWCHHSFNYWRGCRKVCLECENCYISESPIFRFSGMVHGGARVLASESYRKQPYTWDRKAKKAGEMRRVFALSLGDWLDDENVPIAWLAGLLRTVLETPNLIWMLLTKRGGKFRARLRAVADFIEGKAADEWWGTLRFVCNWLNGYPPGNVWLGVSAGVDPVPILDAAAKVHFLSAEPMLRPLDREHADLFDLVIFGGESGKFARPCDVEWIRDGVEYCSAHGIKVFVKQLGSRAFDSAQPVGSDSWTGRAGRWKDGRFFPLLHDEKGGDPSEWPDSLQVREFPGEEAA